VNLFVQFIEIKNVVAKACVARKPYSINQGGDTGEGDFLGGKVRGYLLVKACGFQACQFVASVPGG